MKRVFIQWQLPDRKESQACVVRPVAEDDTLVEQLAQLKRERDVLFAACDQVQRAYCGDGVVMSEAVDTVLLALEKSKRVGGKNA